MTFLQRLAALREQLREYEALRSAKRRMLPLKSVEELPQILIQARIAADLSQEQLAYMLGLKTQQIQRYEATGYASASWTRITRVLRALSVSLQGRVILQRHALECAAEERS